MSVRAVALFVVYLVSPGALEFTADVVHEITAGHTLDADVANDAHDSHDAQTEHHCTGALHTCGCCTSLTWTSVETARLSLDELPSPKLSPSVGVFATRGFVLCGVDDAVFRPPIGSRFI